MRRYFWEVGLARMVVRVFRSVSTAREEGERRLQERVICSRKGLEERAEGTFTEGWDATGADLILLLFVVVAWPLKRWRAAVPDFLTAADLTDVGLEDDASCLLRAIASFKSSSSEFDECACEEVAEGDGRVMSTTVGVAAGGGFRSRATARSRLLSVRERASRHEVSGKPCDGCGCARVSGWCAFDGQMGAIIASELCESLLKRIKLYKKSISST